MATTYLLLKLVILILALRVSSQIVQDDWLMPALPDRSTKFTSGNKYTINWRESLQDWFAEFCEICNTTNVDLYVFNSDDTKYSSRIARGIDVTVTQSYDWVVNIDSDEFTVADSWAFRFVPFEYEDTSGGEISSPTFSISGLKKESSGPIVNNTTSTATTNTATATPTTESSGTATSSPSPSGSLQETPSPDSASRSKVWIAGVVVGPLIGICAGAALVWFCLRKRGKKTLPKEHGLLETYDVPMTNQDAKQVYFYSNPPYTLEAAAGSRSPVEVPSNPASRAPAELA